MHLVELDAQVGDAGARALAGFEFEQVGVAVLADAAQFVEFGVEARRDHAAVAQQHRGFVGDRGGEHREDLGGRRQRLAEHVEQGGLAERHLRAQRGQGADGGAQPGELARAHLAQRQARGDALDVADAAQRIAQLAEPRRMKCIDRVVTLGCRAPFAPRVREPVAQRARAHAGAAGVDQRQQGRRILAAQRLREFEVAVRGRREVEKLARALHLERAHVRECLALRVLGEGEQRGAGGLRGTQVLRVEAGEAGDAQLLAQLAQAERGVELPGRAVRDREPRALL